MTEKGCSWCSNFPKIQEHKDCVWFGRDQFLCQDCAHDPEVSQYITN